MTGRPPYIDPRRIHVREQDVRLGEAIDAAVEPYTGTLYVTDVDAGERFHVRVGPFGGPVVTIPRDRRLDNDDDVILDLARRARAAWRALEPLEVPDNIERGTE
jgi:hypothetical protein